MKFKTKLVTTQGEYEQCLTIRRNVFIEEQSVPEEIEIDEYEDSSKHFLVTFDDKPVATGRLREKGILAKFERIASIASIRGLGAGKALMNEMLEYALKNYPSSLPAMHAQKSAYGFYEKLGWICVGEEFYEADIPHKMMIYIPQDSHHVKRILSTNDQGLTNEIRELLKFSHDLRTIL